MIEQFLVTAYEDATLDIESAVIDVAFSYAEAQDMKEEFHREGYQFVEIEEV